MPRLRQVSRDEATAPIVGAMYDFMFGPDRDPVADPGTATGTPGRLVDDVRPGPRRARALRRPGSRLYRSPKRTLPAELRELGQFRAGWARQSQFVYTQHAKSCRALGMPEEKIAALPHWPVADCWSPAERAVLAYTDALVLEGGRVSDGVFAALREHLTDEQILELTYITCLYEMHATMSRALRTEWDDRDEPIVEVARRPHLARPRGRRRTGPHRGARAADFRRGSGAGLRVRRTAEGNVRRAGVHSAGMCLMPLMKPRAQAVGLADRADVGQAAQQLAEHHRDLAAGEVGAQAEVRARAAEADVVVGRAPEVEPCGSSNTASSRLPDQYQSTTLSPSENSLVAEAHAVLGDRAAEVDDRRRPAHDLLDRGGRQAVDVVEPALLLVGVLGQRDEAVGDGVAGGLVAGHDEQDEERRQLLRGQAARRRPRS